MRGANDDGDAFSRSAGAMTAGPLCTSTTENPLLGLEVPVVPVAVGARRGLDALDLGCGTGRHAPWLADRGATATGVDCSEGMLAAAPRKPGAEAAQFIVHDLHDRLPLPEW
jgi:2-polyprenyl-3-methyl-5-hydroxy-6-metoxy-1,4-benzoquinol methylase